MGGGGFSYMTVEDADRTANYINSLGEITRLNADAQEYSYQAQVLRANKGIYETQNALTQALISQDTSFGVSEYGLKAQQDTASTQGKILTDIIGQQLTETKGAYDVQQKELALRGQASELLINTVQTTNDLKEKLYNIRRGVESAVGKITASFAERGITSQNAQAIINSDLEDRLYRASIASDTTLSLIQYNSDRLGLLDQQNQLNYAEYRDVTSLQRQGLNQDIYNAQNNLNLQLQLYNLGAERLIQDNAIKSQQAYYDTSVKTYQDEVQARLYEHKSNVAEQLAQNQLEGAKLKFKAGEKDAKYIRLDE